MICAAWTLAFRTFIPAARRRRSTYYRTALGVSTAFESSSQSAERSFVIQCLRGLFSQIEYWKELLLCRKDAVSSSQRDDRNRHIDPGQNERCAAALLRSTARSGAVLAQGHAQLFEYPTTLLNECVLDRS